ncbi:MAG: M20/M25/M40 family metallo-hydrolase [Gemmatimonadetes bacterium]|nr:M20/M25/M40 family metallo-hydrolase [Gemmatimonadota bacterium]
MTDPTFLERLLDAPGPSGFETRPARVWRGEAEGFADDVAVDLTGNSFATVNPDGHTRLMLAGHIDEIGLQVTHVDKEGYLWVEEIGGWDPQVLVGQRVRVLAEGGDVRAVVGKKPIHLMTPEDRKKELKTAHLWLDVGTSSREETLELGVRVGDAVTIAQGMERLAGNRIVSRAVDDRVGAWVALEALRLLAADRPSASVTAVATVQEEIGYSGGGARAGAYALRPGVALVVDVTFATDVPGTEKKALGDHALGSGPVISRGAAAHGTVFTMLCETADQEGIPYSVQASPKATRTDADGIFLTRSGVPTGLLSIPNRYMHSPNEIVDLGDLEHTARLMAAFARRLESNTDFTPR